MQINSHTLDGDRSRVKVRNDAVRSLSFYNEAPQDELTLDEFELFSLDRLQLLRGIETSRTKGYEGKEFTEELRRVSVREMMNRFLRSNSKLDPGFLSNYILNPLKHR